MRRAALVVIIMLLAVDSADACHRYRVWNYPRPQSCRFSALAPAETVRRAKIAVPLPPRPPEVEFSLPSLTDIDWGGPPDDEQLGRLLLRIMLPRGDQ